MRSEVVFKHKKNAIICIGGGVSQIPLIITSQRMGMAVLVIDRDENATGVEYADVHLNISTHNKSDALNKLSKLQKDYKYQGVVCRSSGAALYTAAAISERFKLNGLTLDIIKLATEKSKLRRFCVKNGFNMPRGVKVQFDKGYSSDLSLPMIVKPDFPLIGKKDISLIWDNSNLNNAIKEACRSSGNKCAEIEEYIEGIDVSVLFFMNSNKTVIISYWDELVSIDFNGKIEGLGVSVPSVVIGTAVQREIEEIVAEFSHHFSNVKSLMLLSFRIDLNAKPYIIELHADLGGDLIADELLPRANPNFNFFKLAVKTAIGKKLCSSKIKLKPVCLIYNANNYPQIYKYEVEVIGDNIYVTGKTLNDNLKYRNYLFQNRKKSILKFPGVCSLIERN